MNNIVAKDDIVELENVKLKKHSALIQVSGNKIGIVQKKAFLGLLYYARAQRTVDENRTIFEIPYSQLKSLCNISSPNNKELHRQLEGLMGTVVRANYLNKDKKNRWSAFSLLSSAREGEMGMLQFSLPLQVEETLVSPDMYSLIDMKVIREISNKYALDLYELCFDYRKYGVPELTIDDFRSLVGVPDGKYPTFKELNKFVIKKSVDEINKKSNINVNCSFIKSGRSVSGLKFNVTSNQSTPKPQQDVALSQDVLDAIKEISNGKGVSYYVTVVNKMLLGDPVTTMAINNFIEEKKISETKAMCSNIVVLINKEFIGQSISIQNQDESSVFCISGASTSPDGNYVLFGKLAGGEDKEMILTDSQLMEAFGSSLKK